MRPSSESMSSACGTVRLALLPSPSLGPAAWAPVADALRRRGRDVLVPPPYAAVRGPADVLDHLLAAIPAHEPAVLVPHSNAGVYCAALAAVRDVRALVFVDAGLPDDAPTTALAPAAFREFLSSLADDRGLLPVWSRWWAGDDVAGPFPDTESEAAVVGEQVRLPLSYFDAVVPSPAGWRELPSAYLAFGDAYRHERDLAEGRGWPTRTLAGGHLHALHAPHEVADALLGLLGRLGL